MSLYKLESEHATWVNLDSEPWILEDHLCRLRKLIAKAMGDIAIIEGAIDEGNLLQQTVSEVPRETV